MQVTKTRQSYKPGFKLGEVYLSNYTKWVNKYRSAITREHSRANPIWGSTFFNTDNEVIDVSNREQLSLAISFVHRDGNIPEQI